MILTVEIRSIRRGGRTWLVTPGGQSATTTRRPDRALIKALHLGHRRLREAGASPILPLVKLVHPKGIADRYAAQICRLAFLAPDIQAAIIEGRQPPGLTLQSFIGANVPLSWTEQRRMLGFAAPPERR